MKLCVLLLTVLSVPTASAAPDEGWQYHGVHLGEEMTRDQIMAALGAPQYTTNPDFDVRNKALGCADRQDNAAQVCKDAPFYKYGAVSHEALENEIGPYCEDAMDIRGKAVIPKAFSCRNSFPPGSAPDWSAAGQGVIKVAVFVRNSIVSTIDLYFDSSEAEAFFEFAQRRLGTGDWTTETEDHMWIANWEDVGKGRGVSGQMVQRVTMTKKAALSSAVVTNYDSTLSHPTVPTFRGVCELVLQHQAR